MKFLVVLVAVFGLAYCETSCSAPSPNLMDEIKKFQALLPIQEITKVALQYITSDAEVQQVLAFLQGKEFAKVVSIWNNQPLMQDLYSFMCKNGIEIYKALNSLNDLLGLPHVTPPPTRIANPSTRTFRQFIDDIEKLIPIQKMEDMFKQEEKNSPVWKALVDKISSKDFRAMIDKILDLPESKTFQNDLKKLGADPEKLFKIFRELLGWSTY